MRVLRIRTPGADAGVVASLDSAMRAFNAALDIRLRFLSIGIEAVSLDVPDAAIAAESVGAALAPRDGRPAGADAVLLVGGGAAAVAVASTALRAHVPVLRVGAGERAADAGPARATDRLCPVLLVHDAEQARVLRDEGLTAEIEDVGAADAATLGDRIVRALMRARRR
ncbi:MAG: hypothetical protein K8T90_11925 [Planctomycetes bacterium]|nr:hypothetical protein [Planctomycetota bacterium]